MDEVDFTILAATSVFSDLVDKCPPAEACRDAFDRTAKATIKMSNSTGGFGQVLHRNKRSGSKGSMEHHRLDWTSRSDSASVSSRPHRHHHRSSLEHPSQRSSQLDLASVSDTYSNSATSSHLPPMGAPNFRLSALSNIKGEPDGFGFGRPVPGPPRSNASGSDIAVTPDTAAIDPSLMPSPTVAQHRTPPAAGSPVSSITPQASSQLGAAAQGGNMGNYFSQQQVLSPGGMNFANLQEMDFLQGLGNTGTADANGDTQMDLNFGLGWEGLHHDFSDGQQVDLFDGFFFGGQQGGSGANGVGGGI